MKCGFDKHFFEVFEKHIRGKAPLKRHGILLVDEISLRESISVVSSDLTYRGLVDFGEDGKKAESVDEKANTGLVFMFQPLADNYTQPIAVFAFRGPVKGVELAKLVTKALILLENFGAVMHGIVDPNESFVRWKHFEVLYSMDKSILNTQLRMCPKLTLSHLELSNMSKMKVRLATQLFSNSIVHGLKFHKARHVSGLEDCNATINFCQRFNDLFDALNRKTPNEGLTPSGNDFKVLQSSLEWLNNWENNFRSGKIQASEFLTSNTAEGLRVTIQSSMNICETLTAKHNFQYILTGRINQDSLEKFFGIIRQAAGANDHSSTPTFLQLYKLLSMYSILKPPASGNCTLTETSHPKTLITVSELRSIYQKPTETSLIDLKARLDGLIEETEWELDDVVEHDYSHAPVVNCIIYYVTGLLQNYICNATYNKCQRYKCRY
ncbi:hypothetical protein RF55_8168 [Lasius niger]|uniref:Transposable element p transposase n=1 Tax=Lasius niger TaxID=67767 RepID=A0A0J7KNF8_LASNI|nr:hypothetical protein RF55_8168 [Lasius niger]